MNKKCVDLFFFNANKNSGELYLIGELSNSLKFINLNKHIVNTIKNKYALNYNGKSVANNNWKLKY